MNTMLRQFVPRPVQRLAGLQSTPDTDDILQGALAGAMGGIVGTFAMAGVQQVWMRLTSAASGANDTETRNRRKNAGIGRGQLPQAEPRSHHQHNSPSERLVETMFRGIIHRPASRRTMKIGGSAIHFAFGASMGAIYGAAAEVEPRVTAGQGTLFGSAVFLTADEIALPLTGLAQPPHRTPLRRHLYSLVSHLAYGAATELVRRVIRNNT